VPESFPYGDLEEAGEVSTITDTAAESSLFTYASSSKHCNSTELRLAAASFLETIRESVLANNKSQGQQLLQACKESSSSLTSSTSNGTVTSTLTLRDGSEDSSTTTSSELKDEMTSSPHRSSTEHSIPLPQPTLTEAPSYSVQPMVVIHRGDNDNAVHDIHNEAVSVSSSSHCSASSHSTMSTNVLTHPSYEDVEKSLMKDEHFTRKLQEEDLRLKSYLKCFYMEDSRSLTKAVLIGCFFGVTTSVIIIFSHLIFHTKH
jgi:type III secretory pathway component EscV